MYYCNRGFITSCKEDLSVKRHLAVTNCDIFIHTMEHDQRHFNAL